MLSLIAMHTYYLAMIQARLDLYLTRNIHTLSRTCCRILTYRAYIYEKRPGCQFSNQKVTIRPTTTSSIRRGSRILERGGGRGVWVINWQCAHRRCAPLGGLKACPLGTFEILDAFSCNLVHIFCCCPIFLFFLPIFCR